MDGPKNASPFDTKAIWILERDLEIPFTIFLVKTPRLEGYKRLEPSGLEKCQKWAYLDAWMRMAKVTMIITILEHDIFTRKSRENTGPDGDLWLEPSGLEKCQKWAYLDAWMRMAKVTMIITIRTPATTPSMVNISGSSSIWRASPSAKIRKFN